MRYQDDKRTEMARDLRSRETNSEAILWEHLCGSRFEGLKFRRQRPIGPYIVDFACESLNLIVEIDGSVHETAEAKEYDVQRDEYLSAAGYMIIRVSATQVETQILQVRLILSATIAKIRLAPAPGHPSPRL
jgi:very-short-patch-repair endonuclease